MDEELDADDLKKSLKIESKEGLKISYEKNVIKKNFPHLMEEISGNKKSLKIDSSITLINESGKENLQNSKKSYPKELFNPKPIDFIRRCKTFEEAISILDFLLQRKEISLKDYNLLKNQIKTEDGLKKLIEKFGGFKKPGYYERIYRSDIKGITKNKK